MSAPIDGDNFFVNEPELTATAGRARALGDGLAAVRGFADAAAAELVAGHAGWVFTAAVQSCGVTWDGNVGDLSGQYTGVGTKFDETVATYEGVETPVARQFEVDAV